MQWTFIVLNMSLSFSEFHTLLIEQENKHVIQCLSQVMSRHTLERLFQASPKSLTYNPSCHWGVECNSKLDSVFIGTFPQFVFVGFISH